MAYQLTDSGLSSGWGDVKFSLKGTDPNVMKLCNFGYTKKVNSQQIRLTSTGSFSDSKITYTLPEIAVGELGVFSGYIFETNFKYYSPIVKLPSTGSYLFSKSAMFPATNKWIEYRYNEVPTTKVNSVETYTLNSPSISMRDVISIGQVTSTTASWSISLCDDDDGAYLGSYNFTTSDPLFANNMIFQYGSGGSEIYSKVDKWSSQPSDSFYEYSIAHVGRLFYFRIT